jgi:predicted lipid carrier protein YhbT
VIIPVPASLDEAADWLRKRFDPESAVGLHLRYAFELTGAGGGWLGVRVADGRLDVGPAVPPEPDVRLRLDARDFFGVLAGRENADMLFMSGRLEVDGDHVLALKLRRIFRAPV